MEIWHNPRCSKSRAAKALLDDQGVDYVERRYLDDPPTAAELAATLTALGIEPRDLVRRGDAKDLGLDLDALGEDRDAWIATMVANPRIIERPVVVTADGRAAVGRPLDNVIHLLEG